MVVDNVHCERVIMKVSFYVLYKSVVFILYISSYAKVDATHVPLVAQGTQGRKGKQGKQGKHGKEASLA